MSFPQHQQSYEMTPPSTSNSPPSYNGEASSTQAAKETAVAPPKAMSRLFRFPLILLVLVTFCFGITTLGLTASTLSIYNSSKDTTQMFIPLWPNDIRTGPAVAGVACSALIVGFSVLTLVFLTASKLLPSASATSLTLSTCTLLLTLPPLIMAAVGPNGGSMAAAPVSSDSTSTPFMGSTRASSIASWSCRWGGAEDNATPAQFAKLCAQSRASWGLLLVILATQVFSMGISAMAFIRGRRANGKISSRANGEGYKEFS